MTAFSDAQAKFAKRGFQLTDGGEGPVDHCRYVIWKDGVMVGCFGELDEASLESQLLKPTRTTSVSPEHT
jgi:hypothetical protein